MKALGRFLQRVEGERTPAERAQAVAREAIFAGMDRERWEEARAAALDLALVRAVHRGLPGADSRVRRADRDGRWRLADPRPGLLRTKPQSFRSGDHVELAWEPGAIKAGLARLLHDLGLVFADDPAQHAAHLVWAITRAQPFAGHNVRLALTVASLCLRRAGLPALAVVDAERDPDLVAALARATGDRAPLVRALEHLVWREALAYVEWLAPVATDASWTLAAEAAALATARDRAVAVPRATLERVAARAVELAAPVLTAELGVAATGGAPRWIDDRGERLALAWNSAARGRWLCPQSGLLIAAWSLGDTGVAARLVVGAAGRGLSGAAVAHLALGATPAPGAPPAPAFLLIPDERDDEWQARLAAWIGPAVAAARRDAPFRF